MDVRSEFVSFFQNRGHIFFPSSSTIPRFDPSLLFTSAGMTQFKDLICQNQPPQDQRLVNYQRCLRLNDLEEVGVTGRHLSFFEMLGTWSFGDYWKEESIAYACELVFKHFQLPMDKLVVTIHESDTDTANIWKKHGFSSDQILTRGDEDNFWALGSQGPCGPCTELHYRRLDHRGQEELLEFWNLVFMQYQRDADGRLRPLPFYTIDTGAGLERLNLLLEGVPTVFDTQLFQSLITLLPESWSVTLKRIFADHSRALMIALLDGGHFSNEGRGYALRKVARRMLTKVILEEGFERFLSHSGSFLVLLRERLTQIYRPLYDNFISTDEQIILKLQQEESQFRTSLSHGWSLFKKSLKNAHTQGYFSGEAAFALMDSHGFPVDVIQAICERERLKFDEVTFQEKLQEQQERSRQNSQFKHLLNLSDWQYSRSVSGEVRDHLPEGVTYHRDGFYGDRTDRFVEKEGVLYGQFTWLHTSVRDWSVEGDRLRFQSVVSPFYPTGGGQICDQGWIMCSDWTLRVEDVQRVGEYIMVSGELSSVQGDPQNWFQSPLEAWIDWSKRHGAACHHTATHLLHLALKKVLDPHIQQAGSYVGPDYLRFSFTYDQPLSHEDIERIETACNQWIQMGLPLEEEREVSLKEAIEKGAGSLEDNKYGQTVRTIKYGDSYEMCGGTHVRNTSELLGFVIEGTEKISKGVSRIIAYAGPAAIAYWRMRDCWLKQASLVAGVAASDLQMRIQGLLGEIEQLKRDYGHLVKKQLKHTLSDSSEILQVQSLRLAIAVLPKEMKNYVKDSTDLLAAQCDAGFVVCDDGENLLYAMKVQPQAQSFWSAKDMIVKINDSFQGVGGGKPLFAQGRLVSGRGVSVQNLVEWFKQEIQNGY